MSRRFVSAYETEHQELPGQIDHWYFKGGLSDINSLVFVRAHIEHGAGHPQMDEIIYLLEGEREQWIEKEKRSMKPGDSLLIPRGVVHGCYDESHAQCKFLAILTPSKITGPFSVDHSTEEPWRSLKAT